MRSKFKWTEHQVIRLNQIMQILCGHLKYKPLTIRQIYYQMVINGFIDNKVFEYTMLNILLKQARIEGYLSWDDVEDRVGNTYNLLGWENATNFIDVSMDNFMERYSRDLMQNQDVYIELWIGKDTLTNAFLCAANSFSIPVVICKDLSSISFLHMYRERIANNKIKRPIILYFGDYVPSGVEKLKAIETILLEELSVTGVNYKRIALLREDVQRYHLPPKPEDLKKTDRKAIKHADHFGELAVELEALNPTVLEQKIFDAIVGEINMEAFKEEKDVETKELSMLNMLKKNIRNSAQKYICKQKKKNHQKANLYISNT